MAVIKFSTNITDVRGKSNGSVFAKNKGGNYFRANPKPVQQHTIRHQVRKVLFSDVSQQWRSLTPEQQKAWNDASINFPQINKVGDQMFLSGANLFQKLNTSLKTIGGVEILLPPSMPTLPEFPDAKTIYPLNFQYMPNRSIRAKVDPVTNEFDALELEPTTGSLPLSTGFTYVENVVFESLILKALAVGSEYPVLHVVFTDNVELDVTIKRDTIDTWSWSAKLLKSSIEIGALSGGITPNEMDIWLPLFISFEFGANALFIGGVSRNIQYDETNTYTGTIPVVEISKMSLFFGLSTTPAVRERNCIRIYGNPSQGAELLNMKFNYIIGNELAIFDFKNNDVDRTYSALEVSHTEYFYTKNGASIIPWLNNKSVMYGPRFDIINVESELTGYVINVYTSGPISPGRTGKRSGERLVGTYFPEANIFRNLPFDYEDTYAFTPAGSIVDFFIEVVDEQSGIKLKTKKKTKKDVTKFKPGSELSDTVN